MMGMLTFWMPESFIGKTVFWGLALLTTVLVILFYAQNHMLYLPGRPV